MKSVYEFTINKKVKKQVEEQTEEGKLLKEVEEEVPVNVIFKAPSRSESEQADIVSAVEYSESIRKGILTRPLLERFYDEKGGFLSEDYEDKHGKILGKLYELEKEYTELNYKENKTKEEEKRLSEIAANFVQLNDEFRALQESRNRLFANTAESRAQAKTSFWFVLFLTYIQEDKEKEAAPFFSSSSTDYEKAFLEKRDDYDKKIESEDAFILTVINKMSFFIGLWYLGRATTKEDFKQIEERLGIGTPPIEESKEENKE
jgi:hypothetical protein